MTVSADCNSLAATKMEIRSIKTDETKARMPTWCSKLDKVLMGIAEEHPKKKMRERLEREIILILTT